MDLLVEYNGKNYIIEIKMIREKQSLETITAKGLEQTFKYRDIKSPAAPAYLVIFDRREETKGRPWEERLGWNAENGIIVVKC